MELEKIISISGKPGLYKLISQLKSGFIVEDITNKKKLSIGNTSQVSLLDNIAMYTMEKEVPLFEVFNNIGREYNYSETISHKSDDSSLKEFMGKALPNYDTGRVYMSDIKKLAQWYNTLQKAGYISKENLAKTLKDSEEPAEETKEAVSKPAPKKSAASEKPVTPKVKEISTAKSAPKSTHTKKG